MLRALKRSADQLAPRVSKALQAEQKRFLNIHEYQVRLRSNKQIFNAKKTRLLSVTKTAALLGD
jgi:hypothetical protein